MKTTLPAPPIELRLLGPVEARVHGSPLAVDTRKAVAVLAYLAVTDRAATRSTLAALLWSDAGDVEARSALRRTLSVLNAGLGGVGLEIDRATVGLSDGSVDLDIRHFRAALERSRGHGHTAGQACANCLADLEDAVALVRGGFMDGFALRGSPEFEEWQLAEAEGFRRELAGTLERLQEQHMARGAWDAAITTGSRWLALDPLHEPAHRSLMEAYARSGETSAAIRQYRDAAALLDRELGVGPLPETTRLYDAIRAGELAATPDSVPSEAIVPIALGVSGSGRVPAAAIAAGVAGPVPLVGRGGELAILRDLLERAAPDGRLAAVEGEAGIGKTRLADALVEGASGGGHRHVVARCYPGERSIAFAPIVALLRSGLEQPDGRAAIDRLPDRGRETLAWVLPELEREEAQADHARLAGPAAQLRLFEAVVDALTALVAGERAGIVRLDDLQWADDSTLELLGFLARRLPERAILLLLSWRREELDERTGPLIRTLDERPGSRVHLGRLAPNDARLLIEAVLAGDRVSLSDAERDALVAEAEGLPLYLVEALAVSDRRPGSVPVGIRALLQARLAALGDVERQVVAAAAVIGRSFDTDTVRQVSGRSEVETVLALEELTVRGVVGEHVADLSVRYDFTHARLRDVAYESTSTARRRLLHRRAAEAYSTRRGHDPDVIGLLARIALHEREAGRQPEAAAAFREAGQLAAAVFANREALTNLEMALALGDADVVGLRMSIGDVRMRTGDYDGAIAALEAAASDASPSELAGIEHRLGRIHLRRADPAAADVHLEAALLALSAAGTRPGALRSRILVDQAIAAERRGDPTRAARLAGEAQSEASDDVGAEAEADRILGLLARGRGELDEARALLERSLSAAGELQDPGPAIAAANGLALVLAEQGDLVRAVELAEGAVATARRAGERHLEAAVENNLADILQAAGMRDEAMDHLRAAVSAFSEIGSRQATLEPGIWMLETW